MQGTYSRTRDVFSCRTEYVWQGDCALGLGMYAYGFTSRKQPKLQIRCKPRVSKTEDFQLHMLLNCHYNIRKSFNMG